jgi:hypothetical protein
LLPTLSHSASALSIPSERVSTFRFASLHDQQRKVDRLGNYIRPSRTKASCTRFNTPRWSRSFPSSSSTSWRYRSLCAHPRIKGSNTFRTVFFMQTSSAYRAWLICR